MSGWTGKAGCWMSLLLRHQPVVNLLPPCLQLLTLRRLCDLTLDSASLTEDSFTPLQQLSALRRLHLIACRLLPASLAALTQLTALNLQRTPYEGTAAEARQQMDAALPALTQLRHLAVSPVHPATPLPAALATMGCLHTLACVPPLLLRGGSEATRGIVLPPLLQGAYLPSLRHLAAPDTMVASSLLPLQAATQLESLGLFGFAQALTTEQQRLMQWAAAHPAVRHLALELSGDHLCATSLFAVTGALQRRPDVQLELRGTALRAMAWPAAPAPAGLPAWRSPDP